MVKATVEAPDKVFQCESSRFLIWLHVEENIHYEDKGEVSCMSFKLSSILHTFSQLF